MSPIPVNLTEEQFEEYIRPALRVAKRGYESKIVLHKMFNYVLYRLHTGCQGERLPIALDVESGQPEISYHSVYCHYRKWSGDGSLARMFESSMLRILPNLNPDHLNANGCHARAKKGEGSGISRT